MTAMQTPYEAGICETYSQVETMLDELRQQTVQTVRSGAQLGAYVSEAAKAHRDQFWAWLESLPIAARRDVITFAARAYKHVQRHPEIEDASQLTFALAIEQGRDDSRAGQSRHAEGISVVLEAVEKTVVRWRKYAAEHPISEWSDADKRILRKMLEPLWEALG